MRAHCCLCFLVFKLIPVFRLKQVTAEQGVSANPLRPREKTIVSHSNGAEMSLLSDGARAGVASATVGAAARR
jgi:hypothetical protein